MEFIEMMSSNRRPETDSATTIYINPQAGVNGTGTLASPKNTFVGLTITDNYMYRVKCGSNYSYSTELDLSNKIGVTITSYGDGEKPIFNFTGSGTCAVRFAGSTNCAFINIELTTDISQSLITLIQMGTGTGNDGGTGISIISCRLHNVKQGAVAGGMAIRGGGSDILIRNCEIYDCGEDGIYLANITNTEIGFCNIHHVNQNYSGIAKGFLALGTDAGGDGIQIDGYWNNCYINNTIIDRTDIYTGNKFALILGGVTGPTIFNTATIERCTFKVATGADMTYCVYIGQGEGVIFRYNKIQGLTSGLRIIGVYCYNTLINNNIFTDCAGGIAIINSGGFPTGTMIYNNIFVRGDIYGHITQAGGTVSIKNNIFDDSFTAFTSNGGTYVKENNCYQDPTKIGSGGLEIGGITVDPLFVDKENDNFQLQDTSPCIDSGVDVGNMEDFDASIVPTLNIGAYFKYGTEL